MPFTLPDLPFDRKALDPHMSAETLDFHHGRHHQAYVDKTNKMLTGKDLGDSSLVEVIRKAKEKGDKKLGNDRDGRLAVVAARVSASHCETDSDK